MALTPDQFNVLANVGTIATVVAAVTGVILWIANRERDIKATLEKKIDDKFLHSDEKFEQIDAEFENIQRDVTKLEVLVLDQSNTIRREVGEQGHALRSKIHEFEVFSRDSFVSKASFQAVVDRIERAFDKNSDKIDVKIDKIDAKIDKIATRLSRDDK